MPIARGGENLHRTSHSLSFRSKNLREKYPPVLPLLCGTFISEEEDFSFTIAIGRSSKELVQEESRMVIDVSVPSEAETGSHTQALPEQTTPQPGLYPVASIDDRRLAGLVDLGCLLFAYGGFLMLFGSLGGQFTLSKLTAVVYSTTFAIVYLQYFALSQFSVVRRRA